MKTKLKLALRADGLVQMEITTGRTLDMFLGGRPLEEVLREPVAFHITLVGDSPRNWRYVEVRCQGPVGGQWRTLLDRTLDLYEGSEERRLFELLVRQSVVPIVWVNERIEVSYTPIEGMREAVENTRGVSREDWEEELAEWEWETSESWRPGPRPGKVLRRKASMPDRPIPFFAPSSGTLPAARAPEVDGVTLPAGRRYPKRTPAYWASNDPVGNLDLLLPWLTSQFATTGLWPLLWQVDEDPDGYMGGHGDLDSIDSVDPAAALRERWAEQADPDAADPFDAFPGLAGGTAWTPADLPDPHADGADPARLLLVPCNRPADSITMLGGLAVELAAPTLSAILRSWEQRFAAVTCQVAPSALTLTVGAPPNSHSQATALAAELYALCAPTNPDLTVHAIAHSLLARNAAPDDTPGIEIRGDSWTIGWLD